MPALGGKTDMFPGRETRMTLAPTDPGIYRGQCAELCGKDHGFMPVVVEVLDENDYQAWLNGQQTDTRLARR